MRRFGRNDLELLCVVLFWAFNVTVVKASLREMEPLAFNMVRFVCAAIALLCLTRWLDGPFSVPRRDLARFVLLGVLGHTFYQLCFVEGLSRTTASSTALIFGATPIVVGIMSRLAGHERIDAGGGLGALLAFYGVYLIVTGRDLGSATGVGLASSPAAPAGQGPDGAALVGDLLVLAAVLCWSAYTVLSKEVLERYSPLRVTALSLSIGTVLMAVPAIPDVRRQDWTAVSWLTWAGAAYSFIFALVVSYILWYRSVKSVGNHKTAVYSNLVPVFGALSGFWFLGERLTTGLALGGGCILVGILLTRWSGAKPESREAGAASP